MIKVEKTDHDPLQRSTPSRTRTLMSDPSIGLSRATDKLAWIGVDSRHKSDLNLRFFKEGYGGRAARA